MKITLSLYNELFISEMGWDKKRDGTVFIPSSWNQAGQFLAAYIKDLIFKNGAQKWKRCTQKTADNCIKYTDLKFFRWNDQLFPISSQACTLW